MRFTDSDLDTWADEYERTGATGAALFSDDDLDSWAGEFAQQEQKRLQPLRDVAAEKPRVDGPGMVPQAIGKAVGNVAALGDMVPKVDVQFGHDQPVTVGDVAQSQGGRKVYGYDIRDPFPGEDAFFKSNPGVAGMAAEDGKITLNPYSTLSDTEKAAVAENEAIRLWMRDNDVVPDFSVSDAQRSIFAGTEYGKPENDKFLKQTIVARILSGDPSAQATSEQVAFAKKVKEQIAAGAPGSRSGEWEKQATDISSMLGRGMAHTAEAAWQNGDFGSTQEELIESYRKVRDKVAADQEFLKSREDWPEGLAQGLQSLPYSGVTMGASLLAGAAGGRVGGNLGATAAGMAASGATAYRASRHDFMGNVLMKATQELGRVPTPEEWGKLQQQFDEAASKYGKWEAIPEAVGNALFLGIVGPGSKWAAGKLGEKFGAGMLGKVAKGPVGRVTTALVGTQAEEQLTEGITAWGQGGVEAEAGLREEAPTLVEAYKESAPPTFWMTLITGGLGSGASMAAERWKELGNRPAQTLPTEEIIDLLDVVQEPPQAPATPSAPPAPPAAPSGGAGIGGRVNDLAGQLQSLGSVPPVDEVGQGMAPVAPLPVDQEVDLIAPAPMETVPPQGQSFTPEEIRGMMPPMAEPTVVPPMQQPAAPAPQESAGPGQDMDALIDEVADELTMDDLMGEWDRQEAEASAPQTQGVARRGRDEDYGIDVEMTGDATSGFSITETGEGYNRIRKVSSGTGGIYLDDLILNQDGEFVPARQIVQAGGASTDSSQRPFKPAPEKREEFVSLVAEIEFQRSLNNMDEVDRLEAKLEDIVFGKSNQAGSAVDEQAHQAATSPLNDLQEPTQAQKEAGNYKKGHVRVHGLDISVENPRGSVRKGVDESGRPWETEMRAHYGYIKGSVGADKDHVDVFLGERPEDGPVYVVDQVDPSTGKFDEHKVVMGAGSADEARDIYLSNYEAGWQGLGAITEMDVDEFKGWVYSKKAKKPVGDLPARPEEKAGSGFREQLQEVVRTAFYDRWQEHEPRVRAAMNTLHQAGLASEELQQAYRQAASFEDKARVITDFLAEKGLDPRGEDLQEPAAKAQPKAEGGRSEQFQNYARWIADPKNEVSRGMVEEIGRDTRLQDGEAEELERMIAARPSAVTAGSSIGAQIDAAKRRLLENQRKQKAAAGQGKKLQELKRQEDKIRSEIRNLRQRAFDEDDAAPAKDPMLGKWVRSGSVTGQVTEVLSDGRLMVGSSTVTPGQAPNWAVQDKPFDGPKKQADPDRASGTQIVLEIPGQENSLVQVAKIDRGFSVAVRDLDSGQVLPELLVYKYQDQATKAARAIARGLDPKTEYVAGALGKNRRGNVVGMDDDGVRWVEEDGVRMSQSILYDPNGRLIFDSPQTLYDKHFDRDYLTTDELERFGKGGDDGNEGRAEAGAGHAGQAGGVVRSGDGGQVQDVPAGGVREVHDQDERADEGGAPEEGESGLEEYVVDDNLVAEAMDYAENLPWSLVEEGLLTEDEALSIEHAERTDPERELWDLSSSMNAQMVNFDHAMDLYELVVSRIMSLGGLDFDHAVEHLGRDGVQNLQSKFGLAIVKKNGVQLDQLADMLTDSHPELQVDGEVQNLLDLLTDRVQSKKAIQDDYKRKVDALKQEMEAVQARMDEQEEYREGRLDLSGGRDESDTEQANAPPEAEEESDGYGTMAKPDTVALAKHFAAQLRKGVRYANIGQARTEAAKLLGGRVEPGTPLVKAVDEAVELGVVMTARRQVAEMRKAGATDAEIFEDLVALYNQQPNLGSRTSTSMAQQAYSTPAPIAFLASRLAGIGKETMVLEPTAGNGMLLLESDPKLAVVNELNEDRAERLRALGFTVTESDASEPSLFTVQVSAVVANPPFGRVRDAAGQAKSWSVLGHETKELDHAIVLNALDALRDDGRAVLIIGGKQGSDATRREKYQATSQRAFYATLYENFNVVDHFSVSGDLYSKQGASYPIDIIVIEGRGATPNPVWPAARLPRVYQSFDELKELFHDHPSLGARDRVGGNDAADAGGLDGNRGQGESAGAGGDQAAGAPGGRRGADQGGGVSGEGDGNGGPGGSGVRRPQTGQGGQGGDLSADAKSGAVDQAGGSGRGELGDVPSEADKDQGPGDKPGGLGERGDEDLTLDDLMGEWDRQEQAANEEAPAPEEKPAKKPRPKKLRFPTPEQDEERSRIMYDLYHWQREKPKSNYDKAYKARKIAELEKQLRRIPEGSLEMSFMPNITHHGLEKSGQKILGIRLVEIYREGAHFWIDEAFNRGTPEDAYGLYVESFAKTKSAPVFTKNYFDKVVSERLAAEQAARKAAEKAERPARRPVRAPKEEAQKPSTKPIKDSAAELKQNLAAAMDALSKFGGLSVREVKEGDNLNLDAYNAAKPHMLAALQNLKDMGYAGADLVRQLVAQVRALFGAQAAKARPYFEKFAREEVLNQKKAEEKPAPPAKPESSKASATALQVPYDPKSKGSSMGTLVPRNMATPLQAALADLEGRRGDLDKWVAEELGYTEDELFGYFAGEQIDAIALALDNIEKGAGFIIGDQTGIGKGRVNAAIIRYAGRKNLVPVFVTMKPDLYADMVRDLQDIGMAGFNPLPTNSGLTGDKAIPLPDGRTLRTSSKHEEVLREAAGNGLKGFGAVFTTYDQLNTVRGRDTYRRQFLQGLADRALFILDESHNAGGQEKNARARRDAEPNRAEFVRELLRANPAGTFYSSATYAKRPDVMSLYHKTDMRHAVDDIGQLAAAIEAGGIPLQQVVAAMLTESGQYIRRERSFEGASVDVAQHPADHASAEQAATIMRGILEFDVLKKAALKDLKDGAAAAGEGVGESSAVGERGASSTNFTSVMHNLIGQSLLAMKAQAAVDEALAALERGEKPIITLANTMGSFIKDYVEENQIPVRGELDLSFKDLFMRYLDKTRTLTRKDSRGNLIERRMLTDAELGPEAVAMYRRVKRMIEQSSFGDLPISPIDFITHQLEQRRVSVGEITGRTHAVMYEDGVIKYRTRASSPAQNIETVRKFNSGELSVIILNQSGSTGISLHSSEKFDDRRKRTMIIAQPELNIDVFMQTLGRVFRTGQVVPPAYKLLIIDLPAEKRPAAVLGKKMAGLSANTTASRKTDTTFSSIPDFLNQYGDMVMAQMMEEDPQLHASLGSPLADGDRGGLKREDAVRIVTGRIPILPLAQQVELYERLEAEYSELMASLEATGQSALEAKTLALDAKLVSTDELTVPKDVGTSSPFAGASHLGVFDVKMLGKPYTSEQVRGLVERGKESVPNLDHAIEDAQVWVEEKKTAMVNEEAKDALEARVRDNLDTVRRIYQTFPIGSTLVGWIGDDNFYGVVTRVERRGKGNPLAPSSWKLHVAVDAPYKQLVVPFSKIYSRTDGEIPLGGIVLDRSGSLDAVLKRFDDGQRVAREKRVIAYGNILAAYAAVGNRGQVVNFEDHEGNVRPGIMFGRDVSKSEVMGTSSVSLTDPSMVFDLFSETGGAAVVKSVDGNLIITQEGGRVKFVTPLAKARGAQFYFNGKLIEAGGGEFVKVGNMVVRKVDTAAAWRMIETLREQGFGLVAATHLDEARAIIARRKDGGAARMSLGAGPVKGMRASRVRGIVTAVSRDWAMAPKVEVVQRVEDLPAPLLNVVRKKGAQGAVEGIYHDGTIYIVADRMTSANQVFRTMLHEGAGHHGLRLIMSESELNRELDAAWKNRRVQKAAEGIADNYGLDLGDLAQRREAVEEVLAHWAETGVDESALDRFVSAVRRALRRIFSGLSMSDAEVRSLIVRARAAVEGGRGVRMGGGGGASRLKRGASQAAGAIGNLNTPMTQAQTAAELEADRTFANRIHEGRDLVRHQVRVTAADMQREVQRLAGSKRWKYNPFKIFSSEKELTDSSKSRLLDAAMLVYRELQINPDKATDFRNWATAQLTTAKGRDRLRIQEQLRVLDAAEDLTDEQKRFVDDIMDNAFEVIGQQAQSAGIVSTLLDNYVRRLWNRPQDGEKPIFSGAGHAFKTFTTASKQRTLETIFDGWIKGYDLQVKGITSSWAAIAGEVGEIVANKQFIQEARRSGMLSTRRKPGFAPLKAKGLHVWARKAGVKIRLDDVHGLLGKDGNGRNLYVAPPRRYFAVYLNQGAKRADALFDRQADAEAALVQLRDQGHVDAWMEFRQDVDIFERVPLYAPARVAELINRMTRAMDGDSPWKAPMLRTILQFNAAAKSWILMTSFFHHMAGSRSWMFGINHGVMDAVRHGDLREAVSRAVRAMNPVSAHKRGLEKIKSSDAVLRQLIKHGLTVGELADWSEGILAEHRGLTERLFTALVGRMPGAETAVAMVQAGKLFREKAANSLFKRLFAGLKAEAACVEFAHQMQQEISEATKHGRTPNADLVAERVARLVNDDFGGMHLGRMGRNPSVQAALRLLLLAPDWTESNWRTVTGVIPGLNNAIARIMNEVPAPPNMAPVYRRFWAGILLKGAASTLLLQVAITSIFGDDDDDWRDMYREQFADWDTFRRMKWTGVDVTPIYKRLGVDVPRGERKIFSVVGHFADFLRMMDPESLIKGKFSPVMRVAGALGTKTDYRQRPFTGFAELLETGKTVKSSYHQPTETFFNALPSILLAQARDIQPIQVGYLLKYLQGEEDGLTALLSSGGAHMKTAWAPDLVGKEFEEAGKEINASYRRLKELQELVRVHAALQKSDPAAAAKLKETRAQDFNEAESFIKDKAAALRLREQYEAYQDVLGDMRKRRGMVEKYQMDEERKTKDIDRLDASIDGLKNDFLEKYWRKAM